MLYVYHKNIPKKHNSNKLKYKNSSLIIICIPSYKFEFLKTVSSGKIKNLFFITMLSFNS